jgi:hypothetical protein
MGLARKTANPPILTAPHSVAAMFQLSLAAMLTAILLAYDTPGAARREPIVRGLASLIDACVQGLVADAVLAGPPGAGLETLADEAGCAFVEALSPRDGFARALAMARHADVLLLRAGHAVERGFADEVRDALAFGDRSRALILRAAPDSLLTRLAPNFAPPVGLIAGKRALLAAETADLPTLARRLRGVELTTRARRTIG